MSHGSFGRRVLPFLGPLIVAALLYGAAIRSCPVPPVLGDALGYSRTALRLADSGVFALTATPASVAATPNAIITPVYPTLLAAAYVSSADASDDSIRAAQPQVVLAQYLMAITLVGLIMYCGLLIGGRAVGLTAGYASALYVPFGFAATVALSELLGAVLVAVQLILALLLTADESKRRILVEAAFGVVCAALALTRPAYALWMVIPVAYLLYRRRFSSGAFQTVAVIGLATLLAFMPWWVRNARSLGEPVLLSSNSGKTMFDATGGGDLSADEQAVYDAAVARGDDGLGAVARSRVARAFREDPRGFVSSTALWQLSVVRPGLTEDPRVGQPWVAPRDVYWTVRNDPAVAATSAVFVEDFGSSPSRAFTQWINAMTWYQTVLYIAAAVALFAIRRKPQLALIVSVPVYSIVVHATTLFINRYFFPVMPAVIVLSAFGFVMTFVAMRVRLRPAS